MDTVSITSVSFALVTSFVALIHILIFVNVININLIFFKSGVRIKLELE